MHPLRKLHPHIITTSVVMGIVLSIQTIPLCASAEPSRNDDVVEDARMSETRPSDNHSPLFGLLDIPRLMLAATSKGMLAGTMNPNDSSSWDVRALGFVLGSQLLQAIPGTTRVQVDDPVRIMLQAYQELAPSDRVELLLSSWRTLTNAQPAQRTLLTQLTDPWGMGELRKMLTDAMKMDYLTIGETHEGGRAGAQFLRRLGPLYAKQFGQALLHTELLKLPEPFLRGLKEGLTKGSHTVDREQVLDEIDQLLAKERQAWEAEQNGPRDRRGRVKRKGKRKFVAWLRSTPPPASWREMFAEIKWDKPEYGTLAVAFPAMLTTGQRVYIKIMPEGAAERLEANLRVMLRALGIPLDAGIAQAMKQIARRETNLAHEGLMTAVTQGLVSGGKRVPHVFLAGHNILVTQAAPRHRDPEPSTVAPKRRRALARREFASLMVDVLTGVFNADMHYGNQRNGHTKEKWVVDWGLTYRWPTRLRWPLLRLLKGLAERDPSHVQSALKALHVKRDTLPQPQVLRSLAQSLIKMEAEPLSQINGAFAREVAKAGWHPSGPTVLLLRSLLLCMADALRYDPDFKPGWRMYLELARQGARPAAREFGHFLGQRARRSFRRTRRRLARSWYSLGPRAALAQ